VGSSLLWLAPYVVYFSSAQVIDDADELERLCERPAPGASSEVHWLEEMTELCGREFVVGLVDDDLKSYGVGDYHVPFDAVILVSETAGRAAI